MIIIYNIIKCLTTIKTQTSKRLTLHLNKNIFLCEHELQEFPLGLKEIYIKKILNNLLQETQTFQFTNHSIQLTITRVIMNLNLPLDKTFQEINPISLLGIWIHMLGSLFKMNSYQQNLNQRTKIKKILVWI